MIVIVACVYLIASLTSAVLLLVVEMAGFPRSAVCGCRAPGFTSRHPKRGWMFALGLTWLIQGATRAVLAVVSFDGPVEVPMVLLPLAGGVWMLRRWRKHPKDKNRRPLGRMLAVVREAAGRLRIVPTPAPAGGPA